MNDNLNSNIYKKSININNVTLENNEAKYFGGVIYTNMTDTYQFMIKNTKFIKNKADVAGGVVFFERIDDDTKKIISFFSDDKSSFYKNVFLNNTAKSHGNIYATHPSKLIQKITTSDISEISSGNAISLTLELKDELDNTIIDNEKYYQNIAVQAELFDLKENPLNNQNYSIINNDSSFNNGLNIINNIKLLIQNPGIYYLKFTPKTHTNNILKNAYFNYKIKINDCDPNNVKFITKNNLFYCENPKCNKHCQKLKNYVCIKYNDNINDPELNVCECLKGWTGELWFLLIYIPFTKKLIISTAFSIKFDYSKRDYILMNNIFSPKLCRTMFLSEKNTDKNINIVGNNSNKNFNPKLSETQIFTKSSLDSCNNISSSLNISNSQSLYNANTKNDNSTDNKSQSNIIEYKIENIFDDIVRIAYIDIILIIHDKSLKDEQMNNYFFSKVCPQKQYPILINFCKFILLLYDISKFQSVLNGKFIYLDSKIISYGLFYKDNELFQQIQFYSNTINCCLIFILYYSLIVYIIFKNCENKRTFYFINIPGTKCIIHNSYSCGCELKEIRDYNDLELQSIEEYVYFYKEYFNSLIIIKNIPKILDYFMKNIKSIYYSSYNNILSKTSLSLYK
ncbi:hypothetical protein BCR32DRAFT_245465 [Anaeromyces robustus]|uniref:Uncharacterized protein n=1 Tax=Anaeromyces robustus TaxID=1754192 RepID=A0A1Y1X4B3_9FUNG|nr:hypothetical protein BCR32DRAFT_245465 [Anaeromyces robustus]|eukprot:ORX80650.1 hypothetical protein BCR32DRAFT_245465 [Anaeromyces robustus]